MNWLSLSNKVAKIPIRILRDIEVTAIDAKGESKRLHLEFDKYSQPYFAFEEETEFRK